MKNNLIGLCLGAILTVYSVNAQDRKIEKANKSFKDYNFSKAINQYEALVESGNTSPVVLQNLADANYFNANYHDAAIWYKTLVENNPNAVDQEHLYRYAVSLRSMEEYNASDKLIAKLNDQRGKNLLNNKYYLTKIAERSGSYTIDSLSINSAESDFSPSFYNDQIVFATARETNSVSKNIHNWNKKNFLDLYAAVNKNGKLTDVRPFSSGLNSKLHESSPTFTKDGKTVYFTRNNGISGKFERDEQGVSRLQIYRATLKNGTWSNLEAMPFNADNYSVAHPTLNKVEDKLYFSSDMPGTIGKSDIWVVDINNDNSLGKPVNLGPKINTESKETFPFITENDILYFASDGHPGLGGMDIFATDVKNLERGEVVNLAEPINSIYDDFSLIIKEDLKKGFFASNRARGKGSDDIYAFTEIDPLDFDCTKDITGITTVKKTGAILGNVSVMLFDGKNERIAQTTSNSNGNFTLETKCKDADYSIVGEKEAYNKELVKFENKANATVGRIELRLSQIEEAPTGTDLAKYLALENIYFNFDKANIRQDAVPILAKVTTYMRTYPNAKIDVRSHTDSRGNDAYNLNLSRRRAKGTIKYLIAQGIDASRITGDGYGESQLTNKCDNNSNCSDEKHQQNRRSEFITIE